jgi:acetolactate synthase-1/2/3 large subunit
MATAREPSHTRPRRITVAQCLLKYLELEGVRKLFGVPGGAIKYVLDELRKQQDRFEYVICRQETGAAYMADGYARVTGGLGAVLVTSGPGATNALTGAVNAQCSNSSVLVISGEVPEEDYGKGFLQEGTDSGLDVNAVYRAACQYTGIISSPRDFQTLFAQALRTAMARPRRTTHISLPEDISREPIPDARVPRSVGNYRATPRCSAPDQARIALDYLLEARYPLLFLGAGCREALRDEGRLGRFQQLIEKFALPVMTSPGAKALVPESHGLSLRTFGLAGCKWPKYYLQPSSLDPKLPDHYDCLMVLASSLGDLATNLWDKALAPDEPIRFIQVDLDQTVLGRSFPIDLGIVAEIGRFLDDLLALSDQAEADPKVVQARRELVAAIKKQSPYDDEGMWKSEDAPIAPQALMRCVSEGLPPGSHVFLDAGNCVGWALHYLAIDPPSQVHSALAMGPMGFGVGSVIGAKLGAPDRVCVGIVGDGAFLMHGSEVSTAARYGVGAIWIVLFDNDLAMVSQGMNHFFPGPGWKNYYQLGKPNLARYAESLGATAHVIDSPAKFRRAFKRAIRAADARKMPQVIIAHHDSDEVPPYYPAPKGARRGT